MDDATTTISEMKEVVKAYCEERDWDQYHNPKDLAIGAIIESAELLEHFRYRLEREVDSIINDPKKKGEIGEEMADMIFPILRLAQKYDIDLSSTFERKMEQNRKKYPVEKARGSNKKYNEL